MSCTPVSTTKMGWRSLGRTKSCAATPWCRASISWESSASRHHPCGSRATGLSLPAGAWAKTAGVDSPKRLGPEVSGWFHCRKEWIPRIAMAIGTAGFTAMLSLMALEEHGVQPGGSEALVTGAGGGVGSMAVALLARSGYRVVASTGREEVKPFLEMLGASSILDRSELTAPGGGPLGSGRWGGAIDTVGGDTLAGVLRTMAPGGSVAACGNVAGFALQYDGTALYSAGSQSAGHQLAGCSHLARRRIAWRRLAETLPADLIGR